MQYLISDISLSAIASSQNRNNKSDILDLSDQNRPTKIAEKMSDLYDNAWTNAYEELEDNMEEKEIIQMLLHIFKVDKLYTF